MCHVLYSIFIYNHEYTLIFKAKYILTNVVYVAEQQYQL